MDLDGEVTEDSQRAVLERAFDCEFDKVAVLKGQELHLVSQNESFSVSRALRLATFRA